MSLINEALKRADAERSQKPYAPPPIEEAPTPPPRRRRRRGPSKLTGYLALGGLGVVCAAAGAWAIVAFVGQGAGPQAAYGLDTRRRVGTPRDLARPQSQPPRSIEPEAPAETQDPPPAADARNTQPRTAETDNVASEPTCTDPVTPEAQPTQPLLTQEDLQRIAAGTSRRLSGMLDTGIAIGARVDNTLRDVIAFASAHERAQQEMARQRAEQQRLAREEAERRRIQRQEAQARRLAREKKAQAEAEARARKRRQQALAAQKAEARRLALEQARNAAKTGSTDNDAGDDSTPSRVAIGAGDDNDDKPEFVLNGILFSYDRTDAVINNKPYRLNETVNGAKVIHIERTMVKLLYNGQVIVLRL
jgi:hypothetical protein